MVIHPHYGHTLATTYYFDTLTLITVSPSCEKYRDSVRAQRHATTSPKTRIVRANDTQSTSL